MATNHAKDLILKRRSTVAFSPKPVSEELLKDFISSALWTPSAYNEQPWRFIYATKNEEPEAYGKLLNLLAAPNKIWAEAAPVLILVAAKTSLTYNGNDNYHALYDTGQAVGALSIQATESNLFMHQMGGFDYAAAKEVFALPVDVVPVAVIALGYLGDATALPEALQKREANPRSRKPIEEIILNGAAVINKEISAE